MPACRVRLGERAGPPALTRRAGAACQGEMDEGLLGSVSPHLCDVGPQGPHLTAGETGRTSSTQPRLPEHSSALAPRAHCPLRLSSEPWTSTELGWARPPSGAVLAAAQGKGPGRRAGDGGQARPWPLWAGFPSLQVWAGNARGAAISQGFPMRKSPSGRALANAIGSQPWSRGMSTPQATTWHLVPAGDPSKPRCSLLFVTPLGEAEQILSAPPHSPCDLCRV